MPKFAIEVTEEVTYGNASHASAAQYTVHKLTPGLYPLETPVIVGVPATGRLAGHIDNLLMDNSYNGVTSKFFVPGEPHQMYVDFYTFEVEDGKAVQFGRTKIGTFRKIAD